MNELEHLKDRASKVIEEKKIERLRQKLTERAQEIKDAPYVADTDFYCDVCKKDFGARGFKQVRTPKGSVWFAFYEATCPQGHTAIRYITDKITDPYFVTSPFVRAQQDEYADYMLDPSSPRFKLLYPETHKRLKSGDFNREFTKPIQ